jgi:hypothetical protein
MCILQLCNHGTYVGVSIEGQNLMKTTSLTFFPTKQTSVSNNCLMLTMPPFRVMLTHRSTPFPSYSKLGIVVLQIARFMPRCIVHFEGRYTYIMLKKDGSWKCIDHPKLCYISQKWLIRASLITTGNKGTLKTQLWSLGK